MIQRLLRTLWRVPNPHPFAQQKTSNDNKQLPARNLPAHANIDGTATCGASDLGMSNLLGFARLMRTVR